MKNKVIVSRNWKRPEIEAFVSKEEVGAKMDIEQFIESLVEEIGSPKAILTKDQLKKQLTDASRQIIHEMKSMTVYVV